MVTFEVYTLELPVWFIIEIVTHNVKIKLQGI